LKVAGKISWASFAYTPKLQLKQQKNQVFKLAAMKTHANITYFYNL